MTVHEVVQQQILDALKAGVAPWVRDWSTLEPFNVISGKKYRGINAFLLAICSDCCGFMTPRQAEEKGGNYTGAKSFMVTYWARKKYKKDGEEKEGLIYRYYKVLPINQIRGLPEKLYKKLDRTEQQNDPIEVAEQWLQKVDANIVYGCERACYAPSLDIINMPNRNWFTSSEAFYQTLAHELLHWTGAKHRLNRNKMDRAEEEVFVEVGSALLLGSLGLNYEKLIPNITAYCSHWAGHIAGDKANIITSAASKAHKAVEYLLAGGGCADPVPDEEYESELRTEEKVLV